ncbi:MAG: sarcosine oxidase subunit gamma, partial [Mesorhizobium sp.]
MSLPAKLKTSAAKAGRTALWLGPDEWLVIDEAGKDPLADCAKVTALHSAVGISHRNVAFSVTG